MQWGRGESGIGEMCAGANYRARERSAKTRYSGHHFSRLKRGASQHDQTDAPAYYMRESMKGSGEQKGESPVIRSAAE